MNVRGLTLRKLGALTRVQYMRIYRFSTGDMEPNLTEALAIEKAVGVTVESWPSLRRAARELVRMRIATYVEVVYSAATEAPR
jgi:hypothetical protein